MSISKTTRRGSFFGRAAENIAQGLFIETKQRPRSQSFFQRFVNALSNQLSRIVRKDDSALEKVEEHGLVNVSLEGDFVQMKPKISFPVKAEIVSWFQYLPPQKRLRQDIYANNVRSLRADRFRRDSDLDRYLGVHPDMPSMRKPCHRESTHMKENHQPFETNFHGIGDGLPTNFNNQSDEYALFEEEFEKLSWNDYNRTINGGFDFGPTGFGDSWMTSVSNYSEIPIPPVSPVLTPPRRLSTPEREAKRRRIAADKALQKHAATCI